MTPATVKTKTASARSVQSRGDLVALRKFLNLTQAELAGRIGISVDSLQNWEQDRRQPDGPARALLRLIAKHPRLILNDLATNRK